MLVIATLLTDIDKDCYAKHKQMEKQYFKAKI
jgi:hypothetical protein